MITDAQLETQGKPLDAWLQRLSSDLAADAWLFHHATLDVGFLKTFSQRFNIALPSVEIIDTVQIEKRLHVDDHLESHAQLSLNACRARYGLPVYRQHHALRDALSTAELYIAQQRRCPVDQSVGFNASVKGTSNNALLLPDCFLNVNFSSK
jgi:DNA polymerase-3 subunit epsilon